MDETIKELIQFEPHWIHEKRKYRELKRQQFGQRAAVAATGEQQPAAGAAAQDNDDDDDDVNEKQGAEKKQSAVVEKLDVRPSSAAPRIIMLKTNKEKEDEERKAAAAAKKNESEATSSSHLQPFPFGGGSRPLVQEIGPGGYRPAASSTLRPLIQEIVRLCQPAPQTIYRVSPYTRASCVPCAACLCVVVHISGRGG